MVNLRQRTRYPSRPLTLHGGAACHQCGQIESIRCQRIPGGVEEPSVHPIKSEVSGSLGEVRLLWTLSSGPC